MATVQLTPHTTAALDVGAPQTSVQAATSLPAGFPTVLGNHKLAWTGADFNDPAKYVYFLTDDDRADIDAGLKHFKSLELGGNQVSRETFPLNRLGMALDEVSVDVHYGKGFALIRGLDAAKYSVEDLTLVYLTVQSHIADQRGRQDSKGNMLVHIIADQSSAATENHHRHSNKSITFHNEEDGDVVGWLTRGHASEGGSCIIASCYAIYNLLASTRPDLIRVLASPFPFAIPRVENRPAIFFEDGKLIVNFGRTPLLGSAAHPRPAHLPSVTPAQLEALEAVEAIAHATELHFKTQPGDMHFINNLAVLHRRDGFSDGTTKRHLVRVRCHSSRLGWALPKELQGAWDEAFNRDAPQSWNLEPKSPLFFPLRIYPN